MENVVEYTHAKVPTPLEANFQVQKDLANYSKKSREKEKPETS